MGDIMYCKNCDVKLEDDSRFCPSCGNKIDGSQINGESETNKREKNISKSENKKGKSRFLLSLFLKRKLFVIVQAAVLIIVTATVLFSNMQSFKKQPDQVNIAVAEPVKVDYAKAFYLHLQQIKYGEGFDWMNAELVDLNQDDIPELVTAYGNDYTMYLDMEYLQSEQKPSTTGSISVFVYKDGEIVEIKEPVLGEENIKLKFDTSFSLIGERGERHKEIYIKVIDKKKYLCLYQKDSDAHNYNESVVAYLLDASGKFNAVTELYKTWQNWNQDEKELKFVYKDNEINEQEFDEQLSKLKPDQGSFIIQELGSDGGDIEGDMVYKINALFYNYANDLKNIFIFDFLTSEEIGNIKKDLVETQKLYDNKQYQEVIAMCNKVLGIDMNNEEALILKAKTLFTEKKYIETNKIINRALVISNDSEDMIAFQKEVITKLNEKKDFKGEEFINFLETGTISYIDNNKKEHILKLGAFSFNDMTELLGDDYETQINDPEYNKETGEYEDVGAGLLIEPPYFDYKDIKFFTSIGENITGKIKAVSREKFSYFNGDNESMNTFEYCSSKFGSDFTREMYYGYEGQELYYMQYRGKVGTINISFSPDAKDPHVYLFLNRDLE